MTPSPVRVTTADQAAARDAAAIAAGTDSFALMCAAGTVATAVLLRETGDAVAHGVAVWCGSGNNGGDGYIVAAQLARLGVRVQVHAVAPPRTADTERAAALARAAGVSVHVVTDGEPVAPRAFSDVSTYPPWPPGVIVDALLGTGARGPLREDVAHATAVIRAARNAGARVIALDVPTGVDASTGDCVDGAVGAHCTVTFGTCKAGLLVARDRCGRLVVADIGLGEHAALRDGAALLADAGVLQHVVPSIAWDAHKGTRGRVLVIGGATGMAGAAQFAARGALLSGAGLVRARVSDASRAVLQAAAPAVVCVPDDDALDASLDWAHAIVCGPGLGRTPRAAAQLDALLERLGDRGRLTPRDVGRHGASRAAVFLAPVRPVLVLDADALVLVREPARWSRFRRCAEQTTVLLAPHAGEFAALAAACDVPWRPSTRDAGERLDAARRVAFASGAHVLLKGAPTCCAAPDGTAWWAPRGSAALATGGTGDVLAGILGALVAHGHANGSLVASEPTALAAAAAWVHGVAGELAAAESDGRGCTVDDVIDAMPLAWSALRAPASTLPGVLAELPAVPARHP